MTVSRRRSADVGTALPRRGRPGDRFVSFNQNHDQIATPVRAAARQLAGHERQKVAATVLFSTPALPLLFQGEEYGEEAPFDYFTSHGDPGPGGGRSPGEAPGISPPSGGRDRTSAAWADPQAEETFQRAKLRWESIDRSPHADMLAFYRALIALRRRLAPLHNGRKDLARVAADEARRSVTIERGDPSGAATFTAANFGDEEAAIRLPSGARWELALATSSVAPGRMDGGTGSIALPGDTAALFTRVPD